jgi:hypothetical protein
MNKLIIKKKHRKNKYLQIINTINILWVLVNFKKNNYKKLVNYLNINQVKIKLVLCLIKEKSISFKLFLSF